MAHNQTQKHRVALALMMALALMISSIDIYTPAMPYLADYFDVTDSVMKFTIVMSPMMSCIFSIPFGRISDRYGRRMILLTGLLFSVIGALVCSSATTIHHFFTGRILQAFGTVGVNMMTFTILSDLFTGVALARYMAIQVALFPLFIAIAPVLGASLMAYFGWRSNFLVLALGNALLFGYLFKAFEETRARQKDGPQNGTAYKVWSLLRTPSFLSFALGHALPISMTGVFAVNSSFLFIDIFGFSPFAFSIIQAIPVLVNFASALIYRYLITYIGIFGGLRIGIAGYIAFISLSALLILGIIPVDPFSLIAVLCLMNAAMPFVIASCTTKAFDLTQDDKGLAVAIVSFLRNSGMGVLMSVYALLESGNITAMMGGMAAISVVICFLVVPHLREEER